MDKERVVLVVGIIITIIIISSSWVSEHTVAEIWEVALQQESKVPTRVMIEYKVVIEQAFSTKDCYKGQ